MVSALQQQRQSSAHTLLHKGFLSNQGLTEELLANKHFTSLMLCTTQCYTNGLNIVCLDQVLGNTSLKPWLWRLTWPS
jgi:hypothetical protein